MSKLTSRGDRARFCSIRTDDTYPLTDLQRETTACVVELQEHGRPVVLTIDGEASMVVQDASAYQRKLALQGFVWVAAHITSLGEGPGTDGGFAQ